MNPETSGSGFPTQEKLKSRKTIQQLFEQGSSIVQLPIKVVYTIHSESPSLVKFGVSVPKRSTPKATQRNKIKRRIREAYRLQKAELIQTCLEKNVSINMMWIYIGKTESEYETLFAASTRILQKVKSKVDKIEFKA